MKIVFFCIPAHGHTNPTLAVVRELVRRGHEVVYYSYDAFREKILAAGARFVSCDAWDAELRLTPQEASRIGSDLALSIRVLVDTTLGLDDWVCTQMQALQPDCIVADSMAVWGKAVARKLSIPYVCSTTTFAFNQHSAKVMKQSPRELLAMLLALPRIRKDIRRLQAKGYPVKSFLDLISSAEDTDTIVYTSPEFQPCADTFSHHYAFVGPLLRQAGKPIPKQRPKLIYISMGTVNNGLLPLYRSCIEAVRDCPWQVIVSIGSLVESSALGPLPEHIQVYPQVDQIAVLEQADVFLTHCGMNSVSEALWYGVPMVLLPKTKEQSGVALRTAQLGAGLMLTEESPAAIRDALDQVLADDTYGRAARKLSQSFHACPGAAGAADKIENSCR